jgi:thiamine biosynthesis lipoprotein
VPVAAVALVLGWQLVTTNTRNPHSEIVAITRPMMGTIWKIEVADHGRPHQARAAIEAAYAELMRIDSVMSEWREDSPISKLNSVAGKAELELPTELRALLERSVEYSRETEGTFDVTWRGMGNIWHFDDSFVPPSAAVVEQARKRIDYRRIAIQGNRVFVPEGTNIGLGGIAKGYAIDCAMNVLANAGFTDALVDGGGDVRVSGTHNGDAWTLGIQHPREPRGTLLGAVRMTSGALSTSGDYERFRIVNGVRYHHIIDPRTGWPAKASISVSVITDSAERGVVFAKGVFILGPEQGIALAKRWGIEALLIDPDGKQYITDGFAARMETSWK